MMVKFETNWIQIIIAIGGLIYVFVRYIFSNISKNNPDNNIPEVIEYDTEENKNILDESNGLPNNRTRKKPTFSFDDDNSLDDVDDATDVVDIMETQDSKISDTYSSSILKDYVFGSSEGSENYIQNKLDENDNSDGINVEIEDINKTDGDKISASEFDVKNAVIASEILNRKYV